MPQRAAVSDRVFRELLDALVDGRYAPGDKLPTQRTLAADLGVNMSGIREALKRLEQLELIDVRHGDAMRARDWRQSAGIEAFAHVLFTPLAGARAPVHDLMEARRIMLAQAARLAAERATAADSEQLAALADQIAEAGDRAATQALDFAFFDAVVNTSRNLIFRLVMNSIRRVYFESAEPFAAVVRDRETLVPLYARAAQAIGDRDGDGAEEIVAELAALQERWLHESLG